MKARLGAVVIFFIFAKLTAADVPDPGNPDTAYVECGGFSEGELTIRIMFVTDNVGDTNEIDGFTFPLRITNSNPAANPVLDTSPAVTYSGSAASGFSPLRARVVPIIDSIICDTFLSCVPAANPCSLEHIPQPGCFCRDDTSFCCIDSITCDTFYVPSYRAIQYNLTALNLGEGPTIGAGRYLFANVILQLEEPTVITVDTHRTPTVILFFMKPNNEIFYPQWIAKSCTVTTMDFGYKPGDANCSGGNANLTDIIYLVNYIFRGGPRPCLGSLGDANCTGGNPNLADIVYLINYVFRAGPPPVPCP